LSPEPSAHPDRIGPYRIVRRLGAGGMGEVFLAYDDRLDRPVAIKRIRPDGNNHSERRERLRREARVAARLNHPAIVQVYDILHEEDSDYIVMEYVEGRNLRLLLEAGLPGLGKALELARELAAGLDAAHRMGVVHRDLKTENVLVTAEGRAKITDFGIAKQLLGTDEESLTRDHAVLGTYRSMSPEQARGEPVDHRTDLFSFGVLLYELFTGRSPFQAENSLATLNRVIHFRQTPLFELSPEVPAELSDLVDHLLEKDPLLRPQSAGQVRRELDRLALATAEPGETAMTQIEPAAPSRTGGGTSGIRTRSVSRGTAPPADSALTTLKGRPRRALWVAVVLGLLGIAAGTAYFVLRPPPPPLYVGVLRPEIGAGSGAETELLSSGVRVALLRALVSLEGISPKELDEIDAAPGPPQQVAREIAADEIVSSRLDCRPEACRVAVKRIRGQDGSVLWADSLEVPTDDFSVAASAVTRQLRLAYADRRTRRGIPDLAVSSGDLKEFLRLRRRFESRGEASLDSILAGLQEIRERSPGFLDAYLLEARAVLFHFWESREPADLQRGFRLAQDARKLAPGDPQPLLVLVDLALAANDLVLAEETLEELEGLVPGDVRVLERRARYLSARGRTEEALELLRETARIHPSTNRLRNLAQMEFQQGQIAQAREHLQRLLQRSPADSGGLNLLATIELSNGDPRRAAELFGALVRRSPTPARLANLALSYCFLGRYADAVATYRRIVEQEPRNPLYALNLADAYSLQGQKAEADALYRRVLELIETDPAASGPQFLTAKAQALAHLGKGRDAVAAVQEAFRLAPNDGPVAYEAALVYALLGESSSALVNAEKAVKLGMRPRWFSFPWFDSLRANPDFQRLLAGAGSPES
jgi:tetratricopeptide (TPR) repeat protein/tRNA A-37 threonylcarbamoyl transferase component Bud32